MNKVKYVFLFISLTLSWATQGRMKITFSLDERKILDNIAQEMKMIKSVRHLDINMEYRLFELYVEKNKIIFNAENRNYIKYGDPRKNKLTYFPLSYKNYKYIHKYGLLITIKAPMFFSNSEIFYTLAQITKDFEGDKYTKLYLRKALERVQEGELRYKIIKGLAEYYFNHKKFITAARFFRQAISYNTPWNTKHYYNLAWCYEMQKKYTLALNTLLKSFKLSNTKGFVNITSQILKSSVVFFMRAKEIDQAISFYKKAIPQEAHIYILKLARRTKKKGDWKQTEKLISELRQLKADPKQDLDFFQQRVTFEFETYRDFQKDQRFLQLARECQQLALQKVIPSFSDKIILLIEKKNEYLQKIIVAKKKFNGLVNKQQAAQITQYYNILKDINAARKCVYEFHQGEHYFFINSYKKATNNYHNDLQFCKESQNREYLLKSINALLGTLAYIEEQLPKQQIQSLKIQAFNSYIAGWPKSSKSQSYLEEIFKIYVMQQNIGKMNNTFHRYRRAYSQQFDKQKLMLTQITDYYIKHNDDKNVSRIISAINKLHIPFSSAQIEQMTTSLATIIFTKIKKYQVQDRTKVLQSIFKSKLYPQKIKMESSLKLAMLYAKQQNIKLFSHWVSAFFTIATNKQKRAMHNYIFPVLSNLYVTGQLLKAKQVAQILAKECSTFSNKQQNILIQITKDSELQTSSAPITPLQINSLFHLNQCHHSQKTVATISIDLYNYHLINNNLKLALIWAHKINPQLVQDLYQQEVNQLWHQKLFGPQQISLQRLSLFTPYLKFDPVKKITSQFELYDLINTQIRYFGRTTLVIPAPFNETKFNHALEYFLNKTTKIATQVESTISQLPAPLAIDLLTNMSSAYHAQFSFLRSINFPQLEKNYRKGLKRVLNQIAWSFYKKEKSLRSIRKNSLKTPQLQQLAKDLQQEFDFSPIPLIKQTSIQLSYDSFAIQQGGR